MVDAEEKKFWTDNTQLLCWDCPRCESKGLVQYRGDDQGHAICPDCLTVYKPSWEVVEDADDTR